jgi:hypothetical protein
MARRRPQDIEVSRAPKSGAEIEAKTGGGK